jgi:6-phosphogluconolactonase
VEDHCGSWQLCKIGPRIFREKTRVMVKVFDNSDELARAAAAHFVARWGKAIVQRGLFTVALSGGSTPKVLFELLADPNEPFRNQVSWSRVHFFWSDERHVPPDHPESNYRMANEALLSRVPVTKNNVHRVASENPNAAEAAANTNKY